MTIDPSSMTITGVIATALSVVFALAAFMNAKRRQQMRQSAHSAMVAEATAIRDSAPHSSPAPSVASRAPAAIAPAPVPVSAASHPAPIPAPALAPAAPPRPPPAPVPPLFKQYVTRPGMKATTPAAEAPASEKDYVWE